MIEKVINYLICGNKSIGEYNMKREANYKNSDYANGKKIYHKLDFNTGKLEIRNNEN